VAPRRRAGAAAALRMREATMISSIGTTAAIIAIALTAPATAATTGKSKPKPLQVVVMAGQSNMVGHGFAIGSDLHWDPTVPKGGCGGTVGGCVVPDPERPSNLNGSLLTPEFASYSFGTPGGAPPIRTCTHLSTHN
jgi:hypothetical protein